MIRDERLRHTPAAIYGTSFMRWLLPLVRFPSAALARFCELCDCTDCPLAMMRCGAGREYAG